MTHGFVPMARRLPPAVAAADITVDAPPELPPPTSRGWLLRLLPISMSVASMGVMAAAFVSGSGVTRNPMFLTCPMMMLVSTAVAVTTGRARGHGGVDTDRVDYLGYLGLLRDTVSETATAQRSALDWNHPDPDTLWTLIGGPRMWERRAADPDFCRVRVGIGTRPLAARLVVPWAPSGRPSDPVTATALRRFLATHSTITDAPITIGLRGIAIVTIDGNPALVRDLLRAMICQLAVLHSPDQLLIVGVSSDRNRPHWDWLKWLPHNRHPAAADAAGAVRMVYRSPAQAQLELADARPPHVVVIADLDERAGEIAGATILEVGTGTDGTPLTISHPGEPQELLSSDRMDATGAVICARRLAGYRAGAASGKGGRPDWPGLVGLGEVDHVDPIMLWRSQDHSERLCAPIGTTVDDVPLELDIKESAEGGIGPHGLCVGATGSGKSELLRTIALGMMARNSPDALNLLLIDFKGGATFLDFASAPHVAAVITNLSEEAPLVARMGDALSGEMNRRQQLLRTAGCVSVSAYEAARRAGAPLTALPSLFIIVDEFSEMLGQHPDFAEMFVAIGRLGRSLGMHLLLASQRLDEGRLRGLEANLSYRMCLKTLSAGESRTVLGTLDAYQLPSTPGAGFLLASGGEPIRFQTAFVSGPMPCDAPLCQPGVAAPSVRPFSTRAAGPITHSADAIGPPARSVLHAVLDKLAGHGPAAHQVWLPPLGSPPELHTLLRDALPAAAGLAVPIGVVDRPFDQCRTPMVVDLSGAAGNVAVVGAPQSGKSTTLRTLITALAATHNPRQVQFYCLDFGGGALTSTQELPHVGAVAGRAEPRLVGRIVAECEAVVRSREAIFADHGIDSADQYRQRRAERAASDSDPFGEVFLVIDGWASVRHEFEALEASITALAVQGLSFGVHVVLSASRWAEIRPSLRDQIGTRIELRLGEAADSELDRKAAAHVPRDRPGRGLSHDGLHMVIASPIAEIPPDRSVAPPIPLLPSHVERDDVVHRAGTELGGYILLGLEERRMQPVTLDLEDHSHLLILGDTECGKTATLRTLCHEIVRVKTAARAQLFIVDFRRSLLGAVESEHVGGYAMSPVALGALLPGLLALLQRRMPPPAVNQAELRARSWWSGPDLYVVIDDYDVVATPAGNPLAPLLEYLPYARDLGLHLVLARRSGGAERALFEPLLAALRDFGCLALMMSGRPGERAPFGSGSPARLPPGRWVLSTRSGEEQLVQVAWSPP